MGAPGVVSPDSFPARDPRDKSTSNGRTANPPRYYELGGAYTPSIWNREGGNKSFTQTEQRNIARVEKPTSIKSAHRSSHDND